MRISTSKSETMVLSRKRVESSLRVENEILPQVEFKYLGVLFTSEGQMEREIDGRIVAASAVLWALHRPVVVKKELSQKAKLSFYWSIYVTILLWSRVVGSDRKNEIANTSGRNGFPPQGVWALP